MERYRGRFGIYEFTFSGSGGIQITANESVKVGQTKVLLPTWSTAQPR
jgi:hypothetical protein